MYSPNKAKNKLRAKQRKSVFDTTLFRGVAPRTITLTPKGPHSSKVPHNASTYTDKKGRTISTHDLIQKVDAEFRTISKELNVIRFQNLDFKRQIEDLKLKRKILEEKIEAQQMCLNDEHFKKPVFEQAKKYALEEREGKKLIAQLKRENNKIKAILNNKEYRTLAKQLETYKENVDKMQEKVKEKKRLTRDLEELYGEVLTFLDEMNNTVKMKGWKKENPTCDAKI